MKKLLILLAVCAAVLPLTAKPQKKPSQPKWAWSCYVPSNPGGEFNVIKGKNPEAFTMTFKRINPQVSNAWGCAIVNIDREMWSQNKLVFSVRSTDGKMAKVTPYISYAPKTGEKVRLIRGPTIQLRGTAWRDVVFGLDNDFRLGDAGYMIRQLKFAVNISGFKEGEQGNVEFKNIRLCMPAEVSVSGTRSGDFMVVRAKPKKTVAVAKDALKIYFCLDNEDNSKVINYYKPSIVDEPQFGGFREMLLLDVDGKAVETTDISKADLIVYASCRPAGKHEAEKIAKAVREGIPLYVASEIADPEIAALLPCSVETPVSTGLPERKTLKFADPEHAVARKGGLNTAAFGMYHKIALRGDGKSVLTFSDGTPAVVEGTAGKGRVVYNALSFGAGVIPGKKSFDAFFFRMASYLGKRDIPEENVPKILPDKDGWYEGASKNNFGRFGFEIGDGLLVGAISTRLAVRRYGVGEYEFCPEFKKKRFTPLMPQLAIDRINHIGKGGYVMIDGKKVYRYDTSLAFPGVRWEFYTPSVVMSLYKIAAYAAYPTKSGVKILDLSTADFIPVDWSAPWLLLFNNNESDNPLLLVFQHKMSSISVIRNGDSISGVKIKASEKEIGVVVPVWINGSGYIDTRAWTKSIPELMLKRIAFWYPRAFKFPENCREDFRIDRKKGRVEIRDTFTYLTTGDDWNTKSVDYAPVPAIAYLMNGILFESAHVEKRDIPTNFGYFADRDGTNRVTWSLPLPSPDLSLLPHTKGFPEMEKLANFHFARGVLFSGRRMPYESRNNLYPMGKDMPDVKNINMHSSLMGMLQCTENPFIYSPESWKKMMQRLAVRLFEPLERCQYKMVSCWREEPYSGIRYTNYMRSPREIATKFAPGFGTKIIYGDSNETVQMMLTGYQRAADRLGQRDVVLANWDVIKRHIASFQLVQDDWGYLASGCLDSGGSASIDMLNCEYSSMMKLARLAEIAGDDAMRDQALYRGARRMVPTIARLSAVKKFCMANRMMGHPEKETISFGFYETGTGFRKRKQRVRDIEFFDMSQGIPRDLLRLYSRWGKKDLRENYLSCVRAHQPHNLDYILVAALAIADDIPDAELLMRLNVVAANKGLNEYKCRDWPSMGTGSYIEYTLHRLKGNPVIDSAKDMFLTNAVYDPATKTLTVACDAGKNAELIVSSTLKLIPEGSLKQSADGKVKLDVSKPGKHEFTLRFQ